MLVLCLMLWRRTRSMTYWSTFSVSFFLDDMASPSTYAYA